MMGDTTMADTFTRRRFLVASGATTATLGAMTALGTSISLAAPGVPSDGDVLVVVNLGGGVDGLSLTPPLTVGGYNDVRPNIAIPAPGEANGALPLANNGRVGFSSGFDGAFGLHPAAKAIHDGLWSAGKLAVFPGIGFKGSTLSHFTSANYHRKGTLSVHVPGTWLGRMVNSQGGDPDIASLGVGDVGGNFSAIGQIVSYKAGVPNQEAVAALYANGTDLVASVGRRALKVGGAVGELSGGYQPGYPEDNGFSHRFSELAELLKRRPAFGIRAASFGGGNWDHHEGLGTSSRGPFQALVRQLSEAIQAFADDTDGLKGITLVVTSEFGRTVNENGAKGTDHGEALTMLVAGGGVRGGVYGDDYVDSLTLPNGASRASLPITTDLRKPVSEIIRKRVRLADLSPVFPDFTQVGADFGLA